MKTKTLEHSTELRDEQLSKPEQMDSKGKAMIQGWVEMHKGDLEGVARYIAYTLHVCGIRAARQIVAEAQK